MAEPSLVSTDFGILGRRQQIQTDVSCSVMRTSQNQTEDAVEGPNESGKTRREIEETEICIWSDGYTPVKGRMSQIIL